MAVSRTRHRHDVRPVIEYLKALSSTRAGRAAPGGTTATTAGVARALRDVTRRR